MLNHPTNICFLSRNDTVDVKMSPFLFPEGQNETQCQNNNYYKNLTVQVTFYFLLTVRSSGSEGPGSSRERCKMSDNTRCYINCYIKSKCLVKALTHDERAASENSQLTHRFVCSHEVWPFPFGGKPCACDSRVPKTPSSCQTGILMDSFPNYTRRANCHVNMARVGVCVSHMTEVVRL